MSGWFNGAGLIQTVRGMTQHLGLPVILAFGAVGVELVGGVALILGFLGRVAALGIGF